MNSTARDTLRIALHGNICNLCDTRQAEGSVYLNEIGKVHEAHIVTPTNRKLHVSQIIKRVRSLEYHGVKEHIQFIIAAVIHHDAFLKLARHDAGAAFERLISDRPQYISLLAAPYIDARWSSSERVDRLINHASALRGRLGNYDFPVSRSLHLLDLAELSIPDYSIVIDKPIWFCYEGLVTLNIFKNNFRFFSITFSFYSADRGIGVIVGGVQGRRAEDILAQYREFTKLAHGLRPRDFLFEVLRIIARAENVDHIYGVPDQFRSLRHGYFARDNGRDLHLNYDEIWQDRGGVLTGSGMYEIPVRSERRLGTIAAKKHSMYRARYDLLDKLAAKIGSRLHTAVPVASGRVE